MLRVSPARSHFAALTLGALLGAFFLAPAQAAAPAGWPEDPVHVFYDGGDCGTDAVELAVYDRDQGGWLPHPVHPRVPVPSCQVEDAGWLLNELRWRCHDPAAAVPQAWRHFDVFDREAMSRCAVGQLARNDGGTRITVTSPQEGVPVRAPEPVVAMTGSVDVAGIDGSEYDVVLLIDRSAPDGGLAAQVAAARAYVRALLPRRSALRFALISYPNLPPAPGESSAARQELGWSRDAAALDRALLRIAKRPVSSLSTAAEALTAARRAFLSARPAARRVVILGVDGRAVDSAEDPAPEDPLLRAAAQVGADGALLHWVALGGVAAEDPPLVRTALENVPGSFRRVAPPAYDTPFLAAIELPVAEAVWVERAGAPAIAATLAGDGHFSARVPVEAGPNELSIRARTSDGEEVRRAFELIFDDAIQLERVLEGERERIRAAQHKRLELRPEGDVEAPSGR